MSEADKSEPGSAGVECAEMRQTDDVSVVVDVHDDTTADCATSGDSHDDKPETAKALQRHVALMTTQRALLRVLSVMWVLNVGVLIASAIANRQYGMYYATNTGSAIFITIGLLSVVSRSTETIQSRVRLGQMFFVVLVPCVLGFVAICVVFMSYSVPRSDNLSRTGRITAWVAMPLVIAFGLMLLWWLLRMVLFYTVNLEAASREHMEQSYLHAPLAKLLASVESRSYTDYLEVFSVLSMGRVLRAMFGRRTAVARDQLAACGNRCNKETIAEVVCWTFVAGLLTFWIICAVTDLTGRGVVYQVFCIIAEVLVTILAILGNASGNR